MHEDDLKIDGSVVSTGSDVGKVGAQAMCVFLIST
jgi:hypothetical protein